MLVDEVIKACLSKEDQVRMKAKFLDQSLVSRFEMLLGAALFRTEQLTGT